MFTNLLRINQDDDVVVLMEVLPTINLVVAVVVVELIEMTQKDID